MKKFFSLIICAAFSLMQAFSQSPVPTSWDFEGNIAAPPTGWTFIDAGGSGVTYTGTNACQSQALRMDFDNDQLVIWFGQQPGPVTYTMRSMGAAWQGIFRVQESENGTNWTDMAAYNAPGAIPSANCTTVTSVPANSLTRYIRFWYEDKVSGNNLALDDVSVAAPLIPVATLLVEQNGSNVFHNTYAGLLNSAVGSPSQNSFLLKNIGTVDTLSISSIVISGPNASEFVVTSATGGIDILPSSSENLTIEFTPTAAGSRMAVMTINSNYANIPAYVINLYGIGGNLASEPTAQATAFTFTDVKSYRLTGRFDAATPAPDAVGGYIVLRRDGAPVADGPQDGNSYVRGQNIGSSKVVFSGPITGNNFTFTPTNIRAGITYHFAVYTYNGSGIYTNYNTNAPLTGSTSTPNTMVSPTEYNGINTASPTFVSSLSSLINPHTSIFYSNYVPTMVNKFETRDTLAVIGANTFTRVITCNYSGENRVYNEPFDFGALDYSREHTYPHSWMPTFPADNPERPEYNDQHNLYLTRQSNVNATRCNYPLGVVVTPLSNFLEGKLGLDANGRRVYEPRDAHKGRAARAIFYMATCYNGISSNNWGLKDSIGQCSGFLINYGQDQWTLKKWHFDFPPTGYDHARNDFLDSLQTNRNPFVDNPEYACYIDFRTMTKIDNPSVPCTTTSVVNYKPHDFTDIVIAPNPAKDFTTLYFSTKESKPAQILVMDAFGRTVDEYAITPTVGETIMNIDMSKLSDGIYFIRLTNGLSSYTGKFIKQ
jgi:endonuclease I